MADAAAAAAAAERDPSRGSHYGPLGNVKAAQIQAAYRGWAARRALAAANDARQAQQVQQSEETAREAAARQAAVLHGIGTFLKLSLIHI